ncbi:SEC14-like protein 2 [Folsomia candida]|uniref:CRAL-TRIO domain-containing protein n=1 Tax=Folsomia candida TaxID=158441 RepID=A0A226D6H0_FOLCA|nr:SEC14-like protein 2 [Folsomia candida]OXA40458.1 hypothetical protein Fcan01_24681 [Folsomia candida]
MGDLRQLEDCCEDEKLALKQLKINLDFDEKFDMDDMTLIRFLRARNSDLKKTEAMISASLAWRTQYEIDDLIMWDPSVEIASGFDIYHCGCDFEGRPVYYAPLGMWASAKDLFDNGQEEDCLRYAAKTMDMVYKDLLKTKHQNFVCIVDIAGATYRKALHELQNFKGIQDLIWVFKEYEANYPETLHKAFIINTPKVFYWGYNIVKPLMSARTLSKIRIFETSNASWQTELRDLLPECAIPEIFGGSGKMTSFY